MAGARKQHRLGCQSLQGVDGARLGESQTAQQAYQGLDEMYRLMTLRPPVAQRLFRAEENKDFAKVFDIVRDSIGLFAEDFTRVILNI